MAMLTTIPHKATVWALALLLSFTGGMVAIPAHAAAMVPEANPTRATAATAPVAAAATGATAAPTAAAASTLSPDGTPSTSNASNAAGTNSASPNSSAAGANSTAATNTTPASSRPINIALIARNAAAPGAASIVGRSPIIVNPQNPTEQDPSATTSDASATTSDATAAATANLLTTELQQQAVTATTAHTLGAILHSNMSPAGTTSSTTAAHRASYSSSTDFLANHDTALDRDTLNHGNESLEQGSAPEFQLKSYESTASELEQKLKEASGSERLHEADLSLDITPLQSKQPSSQMIDQYFASTSASNGASATASNSNAELTDDIAATGTATATASGTATASSTATAAGTATASSTATAAGTAEVRVTDATEPRLAPIAAMQHYQNPFGAKPSSQTGYAPTTEETYNYLRDNNVLRDFAGSGQGQINANLNRPYHIYNETQAITLENANPTGSTGATTVAPVSPVASSAPAADASQAADAAQEADASQKANASQGTDVSQVAANASLADSASQVAAASQATDATPALHDNADPKTQSWLRNTATPPSHASSTAQEDNAASAVSSTSGAGAEHLANAASAASADSAASASAPSSERVDPFKPNPHVQVSASVAAGLAALANQSNSAGDIMPDPHTPSRLNSRRSHEVAPATAAINDTSGTSGTLPKTISREKDAPAVGGLNSSTAAHSGTDANSSNPATKEALLAPPKSNDSPNLLGQNNSAGMRALVQNIQYPNASDPLASAAHRANTLANSRNINANGEATVFNGGHTSANGNTLGANSDNTKANGGTPGISGGSLGINGGTTVANNDGATRASAAQADGNASHAAINAGPNGAHRLVGYTSLQAVTAAAANSPATNHTKHQPLDTLAQRHRDDYRNDMPLAHNASDFVPQNKRNSGINREQERYLLNQAISRALSDEEKFRNKVEQNLLTTDKATAANQALAPLNPIDAALAEHGANRANSSKSTQNSDVATHPNALSELKNESYQGRRIRASTALAHNPEAQDHSADLSKDHLFAKPLTPRDVYGPDRDHASQSHEYASAYGSWSFNHDQYINDDPRLANSVSAYKHLDSSKPLDRVDTAALLDSPVSILSPVDYASARYVSERYRNRDPLGALLNPHEEIAYSAQARALANNTREVANAGATATDAYYQGQDAVAISLKDMAMILHQHEQDSYPARASNTANTANTTSAANTSVTTAPDITSGVAHKSESRPALAPVNPAAQITRTNQDSQVTPANQDSQATLANSAASTTRASQATAGSNSGAPRNMSLATNTSATTNTSASANTSSTTSSQVRESTIPQFIPEGPNLSSAHSAITPTHAIDNYFNHTINRSGNDSASSQASSTNSSLAHSALTALTNVSTMDSELNLSLNAHDSSTYPSSAANQSTLASKAALEKAAIDNLFSRNDSARSSPLVDSLMNLGIDPPDSVETLGNQAAITAATNPLDFFKSAPHPKTMGESGIMGSMGNALTGTIASANANAGMTQPFTLTSQFEHNTIIFTIEMAPGAYLYQNSLKLQSSSPTIKFRLPELPEATWHEDALGESLVYFSKLMLEVPIIKAGAGNTFSLTYQGCDEAGICYQPVTTTITIPLSVNFAAERLGDSDYQKVLAGAISLDNGEVLTLASPGTMTALSQAKAEAGANNSTNHSTKQSFNIGGSFNLLFSGENSGNDLNELLNNNLLIGLLLCFLLGIGLDLTPCVLPMLPIFSAMIIGSNRTIHKQAQKKQATAARAAPVAVTAPDTPDAVTAPVAFTAPVASASAASASATSTNEVSTSTANTTSATEASASAASETSAVSETSASAASTNAAGSSQDEVAQASQAQTSQTQANQEQASQTQTNQEQASQAQPRKETSSQDESSATVPPRRWIWLILLKQNLAYAAGLSLTYMVLGLLFSMVGASLHSFLQSPIVTSVIAVLLLLCALACADMISLKVPDFITNPLHRKISVINTGSFGGAFALGLLSAIIASPCTSAPLAAALLYVMQHGNMLSGALIFLAIGLGMAAPLLIIGIFGAKFLQQTGVLGHIIKRLMVVFLTITAYILIRPLLGNLELFISTLLVYVLSIYIVVSVMVLVWRRYIGPYVMLAIALLALIPSYYAYDIFEENRHYISYEHFISVHSQSELNNIAKNHYNFVVFTADWCSNCKIMEQNIYSQVPFLSKTTKVQRLVVDITDTDDDLIKEMIEHNHIIGVPFYMTLDDQGNVIASQLGLTSAEQVLKSLHELNQLRFQREQSTNLDLPFNR